MNQRQLSTNPESVRKSVGQGSHWATLSLVGVTVFAAFLRFFLIGDKTVWLDEAFSIWLARLPLWEMWSWLLRIDQHPPLYYTLLHAWVGVVGDLQGSVRGLSALCSTLAVPVFYAAVRRLIDRPTALCAAFILAISPFHVRFAQEARMYGLLTLAVAAALYCVAVILREPNASRRIWWGLAISQAAVMLTHNTAAVYFPVALNLAMLGAYYNAKRHRESGSERVLAFDSTTFISRWLIFQGVALLLWSPWAWPFVVQSIGVDRQFWMLPPDSGMLWDALRTFNFAFLPGNLPFQAGCMALYAGLGLLGIWRLRGSSSVWLLSSLLFVPILIALLVSLRRPIFYDRTLIWLTLPYYVLIAAGIGAIGNVVKKKNEGTPNSQIGEITPRVNQTQTVYFLRTLRPHAAAFVQIGLLVVVSVLSGLSLNGYYFRFEKEGWDEAAAYVAENVQPHDLIVFNATWVQLPFDYYYSSYNLDTELRGLPVDLFDRGVLEPLMERTDIPYLHQLVDNRSRLWLIYSHEWFTDPAQIIPREIGRSLHEVTRKRFSGLQVIFYQARSP